jgi:DNA invertase Pin-like site-specific DNA recombinase
MKSKLAVLYGRVSTEKQTVATQELRAKEYLAYKNFELSAEFCDDDVSGSTPIWERPRGADLRKFLEAGAIGHLVVVKLDRLGRSALDLLNTVEYLDSIGVVLHIVDLGGDSLSTQGAAGRLMFTVLAGMAEYERELIRSRIQDKLDIKRQKHELTGTVPYGWDAKETGAETVKGVKIRELVPNLVEQSWILHMVTLRAAGWGYHSIANDLNDRDVPTKRGKGEIMTLRSAGDTPADKRFTTGRWQAGNVAKVLNSKTVRDWLASRQQAAA